MPKARETCEACRLRRVKCDWRAGIGHCSNCLKRALNCPGIATVKTKPRRGTTIDKLEQQYGSPSRSSPSRHSSNEIISPNVVPLAENQMVSREMQGELSSILIQTCAESHGELFGQISPHFYLLEFVKAGKRFEAFDPVSEVMARCLTAMGARGTSHPAIIGMVDPSLPLPAGLVREDSCRTLAEIAINRYESHGIWRTATPEAMLLTIIMFAVARSVSVALARPFATAGVNLLREYLDTVGPTVLQEELSRFSLSMGAGILWIDATSAAESGQLPLLTADDLEDMPHLKRWLADPFSTQTSVPSPEVFTMPPFVASTPSGDGWLVASRPSVPTASKSTMKAVMEAMFASVIGLLRMYAKDIQYPIRRGRGFNIDTLSDFWTRHTAVCATLDTAFFGLANTCRHETTPFDQEARQKSLDPMRKLCRVMSFTFYLPLALLALLDKLSAESVEAVLVWAEARSRACEGLTRMAKVIQVFQELDDGPSCWNQMSRIFFFLDMVPTWIQLLKTDGDRSGVSYEHCAILTSGLQQAGWASRSAAESWLEAIKLQGMDLDVLLSAG